MTDHEDMMARLENAEMMLRSLGKHRTADAINRARLVIAQSEQDALPKSYIVICKDLLADAIYSNTDASPVEARHIINTALKTSDSTVYQGAKRDAE